MVPINTGSSRHPAESATMLGGCRPGASAPRIRRVTRNSCERTTRENTKLQRRSALLRTVSQTCRDINTTVKSIELVQFAYAFTRTVPAHSDCHTLAHKSQSTRQHLQTLKARTATPTVFVFGEEANDSNLIRYGVYLLIRVDGRLC